MSFRRIGSLLAAVLDTRPAAPARPGPLAPTGIAPCPGPPPDRDTTARNRQDTGRKTG